MDLERVKQNLRLRSGRNAKPRKTPRQPKPSKSSDTPVANGRVPTPSSPAEEHRSERNQEEQQKKEEKKDQSFSLNRQFQIDSPPEHRPGLPHAATGLSEKALKKQPRQYGQSGITIPPQSGNRKGQPTLQRTMTDPQAHSSDNSDAMDFDLKAPAPKPRPPSIEYLSELLFSSGHLNALLHDPREIARFTAFLAKYKPEYQPLILRYLETQKAIKAIEYANAVAEGATVTSNEEDKVVESAVPAVAATLDKAFEEASTASFTALVGTALPMYITYSLVKLVTECLVNEITGKQNPVMRNLVGGLSEVFCLTDPNQDDNPIIYASEEFYRLTGYGSEDVIDHNCRFLQGRKTNPESPKRMKESISKGEDVCETLLNYRRDGRPFINLLLIAPLNDDKGKIKYYIGAQVDVTGLIEDGRGLDGFERYLALRQLEKENRKNIDTESARKKRALKKLQELSEMFDLEESAVVQTGSRASSMTRESDAGSIGSSERRRGNRRVFDDEDDSDQEEADEADEDDRRDDWKLGQSGSSGKLPGIYDSYMLIRPAPSLRIIFISPKLRKIGKVVQSPFLSHVAAPGPTLAGLKESFSTGSPVLAKINFMPEPGESRDGTMVNAGSKTGNGKYGRACWISATPLLGGDDRIGVWMIVVVEKTKARNMTRVAEVEAKATSKARVNKPTRIDLPKGMASDRGRPAAPGASPKDLPIKPKRIDDMKEANGPGIPSTPKQNGKSEEEKDMPMSKTTSDTKQGDEDDQFVIPKAPPKKEAEANRVHVQPDSGHQEEPEEENDWHPARSRSNTQEALPEERKYTPPPEIPDSMIGRTPPPQTPSEVQLKLEDVHIKMNDVNKDDDNASHEMDVTPTRGSFDREHKSFDDKSDAKNKNDVEPNHVEDNNEEEPNCVEDKNDDEPNHLEDKNDDESNHLEDKNDDEPNHLEDKNDEELSHLEDVKGEESNHAKDKNINQPDHVEDKNDGEPNHVEDKNDNKPNHMNGEVDEEESDVKAEKDVVNETEDNVSDSPAHRPVPHAVTKSNLLAMDYLRHPGSRNASNKLKRSGVDEDKWTDYDCMRSPYSVD